MPFVLDASIALAWGFVDERQPAASLALSRARTDEAMVPALWWFEIRNALVVNERRQRLGEPETAEFLDNLSRLRIVVDYAPNDRILLRMARRHRLSVYDAAYLELAQREGAPLATLDNDLARAARAEKVLLI
jgi:predicted nucleic acid-binding protein